MFLPFPLLLEAQTDNDFVIAASLPKMNVLYLRIDNPVMVMAEGLPDKKTEVKLSQGTATKIKPNYYTIKPEKRGTLVLTVFSVSRGDTVVYGNHEFRVKDIPYPVPYIGGKKGGEISKSLLLAQVGISARLENFDFDLRFNVLGYTFSCSSGEYQQDSIDVTGAKFTEEVYEGIKKCNTGDKVYFDDIKVTGPDGIPLNIGSVVFILE